MPDEIENGALTRVLSALYCRSICREFRKPVEVLYPLLIGAYLQVVKEPIDLGTLLLMCLNGQGTVEVVREKLQLVFQNAIQYNQESLEMVSASKHIDAFAEGLFEEIVNQRYRLYHPLVGGHFEREKLEKRMCRYDFVHSQNLKDSEIRALIEVITFVPEELPEQLSDAVKFSIDIAMKAWHLHEEEPHNMNANVTLHDILSPILSSAKVPGPTRGEFNHEIDFLLDAKMPMLTSLMNKSATQSQMSSFNSTSKSLLKQHADSLPSSSSSSSSSSPPLSEEQYFIPGNRRQGTSTHTTGGGSGEEAEGSVLSYMRALDDALGEFLPVLQERLLRGCMLSSIWAKPYCCIWAQPPKLPWCVNTV